MDNNNTEREELIKFVSKVIPKGWQHPIGFKYSPEEISAKIDKMELYYIKEAVAAFKNREKIYEKRETKNAR